ncbi:hydrogenase formation protein HypD [Chloroflexi bacterium TSY]|nr:hydrogenase formation protein HypD [Chloroflexi bacterium TSY]
MKHLDEYRDGEAVRQVLNEIERSVTQPWVLMEVCGGQTHSIIRYGLDKLLPEQIRLVHGPGCPVCVTPLELIDKALALAARPDIIFASYGDMLRVPDSFLYADDGSVMANDLFGVKSRGGDVRIVYSPLDALVMAQENPDKMVVFFAIGFETTAPANAMAVRQAARQGIDNFCVLVSHVTVPPAIATIMESPNCQVNGFLAAGHVCTVMGMDEYGPLAERYQVPIVVTGFELLDLSYGILSAIRQLEAGRFDVENAYARSVPAQGNLAAQSVIADVFDVCDRAWRGIGVIPQSGYQLRDAYAAFDAERRFPDVAIIAAVEPDSCQSGLVLQGLIRPDACPAFGKQCTPLTPLGATMVSSEGACAAYYKYGRIADIVVT